MLKSNLYKMSFFRLKGLYDIREPLFKNINANKMNLGYYYLQYDWFGLL